VTGKAGSPQPKFNFDIKEEIGLCQQFALPNADYDFRKINPGKRRPNRWKKRQAGDIKQQIKNLLKELPFDQLDKFVFDNKKLEESYDYNVFVQNHVYLKVDAKNREVQLDRTSDAGILVRVLNYLMEDDPHFLKYDIEILWAHQWLSTELIKYGARKYGIRKGLPPSEILRYQEKLIKLFENTPWFMGS